MVRKTNHNIELAQALQEAEMLRGIFSESEITLPGLKTVSVPTWRGDVAPGIVSETELLPGLKVFVGVKTPAVTTEKGDANHAFKTRMGVWVWEYSGKISGKTVIAVDCIIHGTERVWWSAAHVGNGRSGLIDDLCERLGLDRIKLRSKEVGAEDALQEARRIAEWTHDTAQLIAKLGENHASYRKRGR
jgi:hypothetical protein